MTVTRVDDVCVHERWVHVRDFDFDNYPRMVPVFVIEHNGVRMYADLENCLHELEASAEEDEDLAGFDREKVKQELLWVAIGNCTWKRGDWTVWCEWVDPKWLESMPEFNGW